jgi:hypothetical protein
LKNITLENRLSLYSDYINKFGNIDIDYDLTLEVVNEYVKTNIGLHIIYDDDIKAKEEVNGEGYRRSKTQQANIRSRDRL